MGDLVGAYLRARRAMVRPEDVELQVGLGWRRVAGLRREELADVAGMSREYYTRLEQGQSVQPSQQVLRSLARALLLDTDGTRHLMRLARIDAGEEELVPARPAAVTRAASALLGSVPSTPAVVVDRNQDIVVANSLARRIGHDRVTPSRNLVQLAFGSVYRRLTPRWVRAAAWAAAALRFYGDPRDARYGEVLADVRAAHGERFDAIWDRQEAHGFRLTAVDVPDGEGETRKALVQGLEISASGLHLLVCHAVESSDHELQDGRGADGSEGDAGLDLVA
ncbi:helix-turn-helix transcriptional regulator [Luteimicrobium xylanilyticum]|uniref:HTH cro/C1-type domain-containing protein n=1 Tax=Luteimicrobium xylanilyticum TaxID=1133546 RepID=A0A5P9QAV6_9MICO|nr:helix-turn-helix domain-containing protein [Luteimicrobium xylanilyticum]QFU98489.1 hypothetical protein KDY119_02005 [Luteimicrobium xylanilyticum]